MPAKQDPDPRRTDRIKSFLKNVASGVAIPDGGPGLTANLDEDDQSQTSTVVKQMRTVEFLEERDLRRFEETRNGAQVATSVAYRIETRTQPWFYRFWLTEDGKIADYSDKE